MEEIIIDDLDNEIDLKNKNEEISINNNIEIKSEKIKKKEFSLSNPIFTEMLNFIVEQNEIIYKFQLSFKSEKWIINRTLSEIKNLIKTLQNLNYSYLPETIFTSKFSNIKTEKSIKEINIYILQFLRYINYRFDILSNIITKEFFSFGEIKNEEIIQDLKNQIAKENLVQIYNFKLGESIEMTMTDFLYDSELGILLISLEDISFFSHLGRFWSLIDYEILGNFIIYQRVFDNKNKPYFKRLLFKSFDSRATKIIINAEKIFLGMDNGAKK